MPPEEKLLLQTVEPNNTILVDGPASLSVVSGKAEVFGDQLKMSQKVVVREGKRLPFFVLEKAVFDISLGPNAAVKEISGGIEVEAAGVIAAGPLFTSPGEHTRGSDGEPRDGVVQPILGVKEPSV